MPDTICTGTGSNGDHCCIIRGEICPALTYAEGIPRCSFVLSGSDPAPGNPFWERLPVGEWFAVTHPGYGCMDWPQNIPDVTGGLCCWKGEL